MQHLFSLLCLQFDKQAFASADAMLIHISKPALMQLARHVTTPTTIKSLQSVALQCMH